MRLMAKNTQHMVVKLTTGIANLSLIEVEDYHINTYRVVDTLPQGKSGKITGSQISSSDGALKTSSSCQSGSAVTTKAPLLIRLEILLTANGASVLAKTTRNQMK